MKAKTFCLMGNICEANLHFQLHGKELTIKHFEGIHKIMAGQLSKHSRYWNHVRNQVKMGDL